MTKTVIVKPGRWATALQWPDGTFGWARVELSGVTLHVSNDNGTADYRVALIDGMRYLSAAVGPDGTVCCCGQGQERGELWIAVNDTLLPPQGVCLSKPLIRACPAGGFQIAVVRSPSLYEVYGVAQSQVSYVSNGTILDGAGGSGLVAWNGDVPIAGAHRYALAGSDGRSLLRYQSVLGVIVGQPSWPEGYPAPLGLGARVLFAFGTEAYISIEPTRLAHTPSIAGDSTRFAVATASGASWDEVWCAVCEPPFVHEPSPIIVTPPPPPPPRPFPVVRPMPEFCKGLNVSSGVVDGLAERGVQLIRLDARPGQPMIDAIRAWWKQGVEVLVIVRSILDCDSIPYNVPRVHVEIMNEPDLMGVSPTEYLALVRDVMAWAETRRTRYGMQDIRVWAGAVSNFSPSAFAWLDRMLPGLPPGIGITMHRYPEGGVKDLRAPRKGYNTRLDEVGELVVRLGSRRPWAISETGWHTAPQQPPGCSWFNKPFSWTDSEVAMTIRNELSWWQHAGAAFVVVYQINDGATNTCLDRYGIRRTDGVWKPQAEAFR